MTYAFKKIADIERIENHSDNFEIKQFINNYNKNIEYNSKQLIKKINKDDVITEQKLRLLYETYGIPKEIIIEILEEKNIKLDKNIKLGNAKETKSIPYTLDKEANKKFADQILQF